MDPVTLVISYYMDAKNMGEFTKSEFKAGFEALEASSVDDLRAQTDYLRNQLKSDTEFPKIYRYVFNFLKGDAARNLQIDHAIAMWDLLLPTKYGKKILPFLQKWKEFLEFQKDSKGINGIKKDEWNSLLDLFKEKGIDLSGMKPSDEDCWPLLFDSFFEFLNTS